MRQAAPGELDGRETGKGAAVIHLQSLPSVHLIPGRRFHDLEVPELAAIRHHGPDFGQAAGGAEGVGRWDFPFEKILVVPREEELEKRLVGRSAVVLPREFSLEL